MLPRAVAAALCLVLLAAAAHAGERCRFEGDTDHAGHVAALVDVTPGPDGGRTVDVQLEIRATVWWVLEVRYLVEEVSTWRGGVLREVAVNTRSLSGGRIVRQIWDDFRRDGDTLSARRVQARTLAQMRQRHPGFVAHWDPAAFGAPWLGEYDAAARSAAPTLTSAPPTRGRARRWPWRSTGRGGCRTARARCRWCCRASSATPP